jgi:hypothetical protein
MTFGGIASLLKGQASITIILLSWRYFVWKFNIKLKIITIRIRIGIKKV